MLDTDWCVDLINNQPLALQAMPAMTEEGVAVSVVTYGELYEGAYYGRNSSAALLVLERLLFGFELLSLSQTIVERFGLIRGSLSRQQRQQVGDLDLLIAATALTHGLTLVTRNLRDFQLIAGLSLYEIASD